ncbi:hypothetical protein [Streptomyces bambusae]|uniref:Secreted protein n=1 Tax=Streptomyces bambusae TaxID=1550616 RepID=A0ABS6Z1A3_9ACTN|nr:hypothetical protein [Streptomyces bambusae]MBW5481526.1 hypothetical protein [Streptomyces bambusae]
MHRGLVHAFAWLLATGAAVTLSWWGVHTVMSGTAYDRPLAVPLTTRPLSSSTNGSEPSAPPAPSGSAGSPAASPASPSAAPSASPQSSGPGTPKPSSGSRSGPGQAGGSADSVKGWTVAGGRVVLDLGPASAELVSAAPAAGWRMQVWKQPYWIRVTFTRDNREVSVFCTWHDHAPAVELDDRTI